MTAYYNEYDKNAAEWLRRLIKAEMIAPGEVDERSIEDVTPNDLKGFTQCHFFAGIGIWSDALRRSGWSDNMEVWTGSCPCQPFSSAGKGDGVADERHLWPAWFHLISQCRPRVVFGEQVRAAIKHGWLDLVQSDLEGINYAFTAKGIPACAVGAPQERQRLWFVAQSSSSNPAGRICQSESAWSSVRNVENSSWEDVEWIETSDGRQFCIKSGLPLLAHGHKARVVKLRAYGNSIVPQVAEKFIRAYLER